MEFLPRIWINVLVNCWNLVKIHCKYLSSSCNISYSYPKFPIFFFGKLSFSSLFWGARFRVLKPVLSLSWIFNFPKWFVEVFLSWVLCGPVTIADHAIQAKEMLPWITWDENIYASLFHSWHIWSFFFFLRKLNHFSTITTSPLLSSISAYCSSRAWHSTWPQLDVQQPFLVANLLSRWRDGLALSHQEIMWLCGSSCLWSGQSFLPWEIWPTCASDNVSHWDLRDSLNTLYPIP